MWNSIDTNLSDNILHITITEDGKPLNYLEVLKLWKNNTSFRNYFIELLRACPYRCFRWETPPLSIGPEARNFEFVFINSPELDLPPDSRDFDSHFKAQSQSVIVFENLGGDANLVVPRPLENQLNYSHIGSFVRCAPIWQQHELWMSVAKTMLNALNETPLWLSTAGGGVPWLHIRLDTRPKYYVHKDYRNIV